MGSYWSFLHPDGIWTGAKPVEQGESRTGIGKLKEKKRVLRRLASHHTVHSLATLAFWHLRSRASRHMMFICRLFSLIIVVTFIFTPSVCLPVPITVRFRGRWMWIKGCKLEWMCDRMYLQELLLVETPPRLHLTQSHTECLQHRGMPVTPVTQS